DWSSDVCSSDLARDHRSLAGRKAPHDGRGERAPGTDPAHAPLLALGCAGRRGSRRAVAVNALIGVRRRHLLALGVAVSMVALAAGGIAVTASARAARIVTR